MFGHFADFRFAREGFRGLSNVPGMESVTYLCIVMVQSPWPSGNGESYMEDFVRARSSLNMSSISNLNGSCPKLASTTSPGVCRPTVGYNLL